MDKKTLDQNVRKNKALFKKIGFDLDDIKFGTSTDSKNARGFLKGLVEEYTKHVSKFEDPMVQKYFHNFIATFMLEFHRAYENFGIKVLYRIKAPKSTFDKILNYLTKKDRSEYFINEDGEMQGRLKEPIKDMFAITVVSIGRSPMLSYSKDPEIKELIEEQKRNTALLEVMQEFQDRITEDIFSGKRKKTYRYNCTKEEYYLKSIILINRIKSLLHPEATKLIKKYDDMLEDIKSNIPSEYYRVIDKVMKDSTIMNSVQNAESMKLFTDLIYGFIDKTKLTDDEISFMKSKITAEDTKITEFTGMLDDFTARIHDKLDLAVLTKQIHSVFENSKWLKKFGITIDLPACKKKRTANGYVSNFIILKTPFGPVEMQVQSEHENREGSYGESAHYDMEGKSFKEFPIPREDDKFGLDVFRKCVEFVSPKKFLAQFDNSEPERILTQVFGKYQNYKAILSQVKKGSMQALKIKKYLDKVYANKNTLFEGEAEQEEIECFTYYDLDKYLKSEEFEKVTNQEITL